MTLKRGQVLGWRLRRHGLDPVDGADAAEVVHRMVALRGWPADGADLSVAVRQARPEASPVSRALDTGDLIRSYAFGGGSYVFTHADAAAILALRTTTRVWATVRWQRQAQFSLDDWDPLRDAVCEFLADGPRTRAEIAAHLSRTPALASLAVAATGVGSDALYKPLHWWGDICFGPARGQQPTFRLLRDDPRWPGLPDLEVAARRAILRYLGGYGPATEAGLAHWFVAGLGVPRRRLEPWLAGLVGDEVTRVSVDDVPAYARTADVDAIAACEPSASVRLLPGHDPWLLGPGTDDESLIAAERRVLASRGSNLVLWRGFVCGTWRLRDGVLTTSWFAEAGRPPRAALAAEVARLGAVRQQELTGEVELSPPARR